MPNKSNDFTKFSSNKFDEKIKNAIRDYYTYGFKDMYSGIEGVSNETLRKDHLRLNEILAGYIRWDDKKDRRVFHCDNGQSLAKNPFHEVYKYCTYMDNEWLFLENIIIPLSLLSYVKTDTNGNLDENFLKCLIPSEQVNICGNDFGTLTEEAVAEEIYRKFSSFNKAKGLTGAQLYCYYPYNGYELLCDLDYKTLKRKLNNFLNMGLLKRENIKKKTYWHLGSPTMNSILRKGAEVNANFAVHFQRVIDFYTRYYVLGTIGSLLMDRLASGKYHSHIRFKHEYYMQSINEFNLLDLLIAIEKEIVCLIKYKHGITDIEKEFIVYPLEIRISSTTGREFLMYYNPFKHAYGRLRLEFIESISYANKDEFLKTCNFDAICFDKEVDNSLNALLHSWGVSIADNPYSAKEKATLKRIKMRISYNPYTEKYILDRIRREKRIGYYRVINENSKVFIDFEVNVLDEIELRPWVRSFYNRIVNIEGMNNNEFTIASDVMEINKSLNGGVENRSKVQFSKNTKVDNQLTEIYKKIRFNPAREHDKLFNEIFSKDFYAKSKQVVERYCQKRLFPLNQREELASLDFYRDVLPLTNLEKRWLMTILSDDKISYFLSHAEIEAVKQAVDPLNKIKLFSVNRIKYYDKFSVSKLTKQREQALVSRLLDAIDKKRFVEIQYSNIDKKLYLPLSLEYSQRDNLFRGYFINEDSKLFTLNISRIEDFKESACIKEFSDEEISAFLKSAMIAREEEVTIEFYNVKNLTDRILTEFSPWKKDAQYDKNTSLYRLTLYYDKYDRLEIVNRLMGYGKIIRFVNKQEAVYKEIKSRIEKQIQIM